MSSNPFELLYLERRAHMHTREKLKKAEHDRERYARRIRLLQGNQQICSRELHISPGGVRNTEALRGHVGKENHE